MNAINARVCYVLRNNTHASAIALRTVLVCGYHPHATGVEDQAYNISFAHVVSSTLMNLLDQHGVGILAPFEMVLEFQETPAFHKLAGIPIWKTGSEFDPLNYLSHCRTQWNKCHEWLIRSRSFTF